MSKGSKAVVFKQVCDCVKDELKLFGKNTDNNAFINSAIKIYDEMKSCRVDANDIMLASQQTEKETPYSGKTKAPEVPDLPPCPKAL